jgi:two-component system, sensor histidine kinase SagS
MPSSRPRLLIIGGPNVPAVQLSEELAERYDVVVSDADTAADQLRGGGVEAVLVDPDDLSPLRSSLDAKPAVALLNAIGEGVCLVGPDASVVWANDRFCALDETVRARVIEVCREAREFFTRSAPGSSPTCKFDLEPERAREHYEVFVSPAKFDSDKGGHVAAVVRDVSQRVQVERKINAIDRAGATLIDLQAEEIRRAKPSERLGILQERITQFTHDVLHFDHFMVRLINQETGKLEPVITEGMPPEASDLDLLVENEGSGITGLVASTGQSYLCDDAESDERFLPGLPGAKSSLTVPLRLQDRVIGVMDIESRETAAFTDLDRQFAEIFARYIAMALHMLDLLVVERCATNQSVSGIVEGELRECLEDILSETEWLTGFTIEDPETAGHISKIKADVERIRTRVRDVAAGPQTLLGVERAMANREKDPLLDGRRVLVADDALKIRRIIRDVLTARGCEVTMCENGGEAIKAIQRCAADQPGGGEPLYDLVISDINMPDRNGYEVFSAARKVMPGVPVVLMTGFGYDPHHSIVRASDEGLQCVLFKPFQIERLLDEVRKAVTSRGGTA